MTEEQEDLVTQMNKQVGNLAIELMDSFQKAIEQYAEDGFDITQISNIGILTTATGKRESDDRDVTFCRYQFTEVGVDKMLGLIELCKHDILG